MSQNLTPSSKIDIMEAADYHPISNALNKARRSAYSIICDLRKIEASKKEEAS